MVGEREKGFERLREVTERMRADVSGMLLIPGDPSLRVWEILAEAFLQKDGKTDEKKGKGNREKGTSRQKGCGKGPRGKEVGSEF